MVMQKQENSKSNFVNQTNKKDFFCFLIENRQ